MDRFTLSSRLSRIGDEITKLTSTINAMKIADTATYGKIYEELSRDAAFRAERIACSLRNVIYDANLVPNRYSWKQLHRHMAFPSATLQTGWRSRFPG